MSLARREENYIPSSSKSKHIKQSNKIVLSYFLETSYVISFLFDGKG